MNSYYQIRKCENGFYFEGSERVLVFKTLEELLDCIREMLGND